MTHVIVINHDTAPVTLTCTCGFETKADTYEMADDRSLAHLDAAEEREAAAVAAAQSPQYRMWHS